MGIKKFSRQKIQSGQLQKSPKNGTFFTFSKFLNVTAIFSRENGIDPLLYYIQRLWPKEKKILWIPFMGNWGAKQCKNAIFSKIQTPKVNRRIRHWAVSVCVVLGVTMYEPWHPASIPGNISFQFFLVFFFFFGKSLVFRRVPLAVPATLHNRPARSRKAE